MEKQNKSWMAEMILIRRPFPSHQRLRFLFAEG